MAETLFEYELRSEGGDEEVNIAFYTGRIAGYAIELEKYSSWLTGATWKLSNQQGLEEFLGAVEASFQEAEDHGFEAEEYAMAIGTSAFDGTDAEDDWDLPREFNYIRPLEVEDFAEIGLSADQVQFLRIYGNLSHFAFQTYPDAISVTMLFDNKPHQTRSAFRFASELLPDSLGLQPQQIGQMIMSLPFPGSPQQR